MARRRASLFSTLTRAYQRNVKALARAAQPARPARRKAAAAPLATPAKRPVRASGDWLAGVAPGPAGARRYHLHIPPGLALRRGEKLPLLVMLHGCSQTGHDLATVSRMNRLAARGRFLVLYPEQERVANAHGCWNWFERRSGKAAAEAATLLAVIDKVARRQPVDPARVAVAGLSAGAGMAALMAALYPQRFCAVAMHSGPAPGTADSAASAIAAMQGRRAARLPDPVDPASAALPPLLVLHGNVDGVVSVRNAVATARLWAEALGARPGPERVQQRGRRHAMRVTEFKTRGHAVVVLREVLGLGHAWSGGAARQPYSDPAGPDASALIWAFAARQFDRRRL